MSVCVGALVDDYECGCAGVGVWLRMSECKCG